MNTVPVPRPKQPEADILQHYASVFQPPRLGWVEGRNVHSDSRWAGGEDTEALRVKFARDQVPLTLTSFFQVARQALRPLCRRRAAFPSFSRSLSIQSAAAFQPTAIGREPCSGTRLSSSRPPRTIPADDLRRRPVAAFPNTHRAEATRQSPAPAPAPGAIVEARTTIPATLGEQCDHCWGSSLHQHGLEQVTPAPRRTPRWPGPVATQRQVRLEFEKPLSSPRCGMMVSPGVPGLEPVPWGAHWLMMHVAVKTTEAARPRGRRSLHHRSGCATILRQSI